MADTPGHEQYTRNMVTGASTGLLSTATITGFNANDTIDLTGVDFRFVPVGSSGDNVGLTAFAVRRYRGPGEVTIAGSDER